jgi:hypothetical protein
LYASGGIVYEKIFLVGILSCEKKLLEIDFTLGLLGLKRIIFLTEYDKDREILRVHVIPKFLVHIYLGIESEVKM